MNAENKTKSTTDNEKSDSGGSAFQKHARQRSLTRPLLLASLVVVCVGLLLTWTIGRTTLCWHIGSNCNSFVTRGVAADVLIKPFSELPAPTYYASANYDADFKRGVEEGNGIARKFFGSCNADVWFLPEIRGSEADYASLADAACEHFPSKYCGTVRPIEDARTGGDDGQNYGSAHVDSNRMCDMGDSRYDRFAAWMPESEHACVRAVPPSPGAGVLSPPLPTAMILLRKLPLPTATTLSPSSAATRSKAYLWYSSIGRGLVSAGERDTETDAYTYTHIYVHIYIRTHHWETRCPL